VTGNSWLWIPAAIVAVAALLLGARWRAPRAGAWAALAALGQASVLMLVKAGPNVGYQHLTLTDARRDQAAPLVVAVAFVLIAAVGVLRRIAVLRRLTAPPSRPWTWIAALAVGTLLAAAPSAGFRTYAIELVLTGILQLAALACVAIAASELPDERVAKLREPLARWLEPSQGPPRLDRYAWGLAAAVTIVAALLCLTSYQAIPHIPDEIAYLVQARYFAAGQPWMSAPPVPAAFDTFLLEVSGARWYSVFPPGWPLVLAIGAKLGVPWLVNPVLGGAGILLTYLLVQELADRRLARLSTTLLAVSPWYLLMSMSFMSHPLSLVLALLTALGTARACRTGAWRPALGAGLALGILGMSRPLEGVAIGAVAGIPLLVVAMRKARAGALVAAVSGTLITGGMGLAYNAMITGSALRFPAEQYFDREYGPGRYGMGFGPEKGLGWQGLDPFPGHGAIDVGVNTVLNGFMINIDLFGWVVGSAAIVLLGLFQARKGIDRLMAATIATVVLLHSAYWFSGGPDFGARYWYLVIVPVVVLAARGLSAVERSDESLPGVRIVMAAGWLSVLALTLFIPWRGVDKYRHYRGIRPDVVSWRSDPRFRSALVLVSGQRHPDWAGAAIANELEIGASDAPVFAWDRDSTARRAVLDAFPERTVWLVDGPQKTGGGYEVTRGPISPADRSTLVMQR
jgi:hypothetical protein